MSKMKKAHFRQDNMLGVVTLHAPPLNLVDREMIDDLAQCIVAAEEAPIRALLLRAEGDQFSAGAHVEDMFQGRDDGEALLLLRRIAALLRRFEQLSIPTLAAVQGMCLAGGFELALACDMIWASDNAQMGLVETVIGAVPFGGGIQRLAARAGVGRAREAVFTARTYDATMMAHWHVVNRVVASGDLASKSMAFAHRLAAGPTLAYAATKRILRVLCDEGIHASDQELPAIASSLFVTEGMQQGIVTLLEKGPGQATFTGS